MMLSLYPIVYLSLGLIIFGLLVRQPGRYELFGRAYRAFLLRPWKLATFVVGLALIVFAAPYADDSTWDTWDALFMSVLTFATAPWAVGAAWRSVQERRDWDKLFVAIWLAMFSSSWSYDLYILWRDGFYPQTWLPNIAISLPFYLAAGLFWNLAVDDAGHGCFAFRCADWLQRTTLNLWVVLVFPGGLFWGFAVTVVMAFLLTKA